MSPTSEERLAFKRGELQAVRDLMCNHDVEALRAEATAAAEQRLRDSVAEAELDAPEEARRFVPPFEGGFREGARWALNRWRSALAATPSAEPAGLRAQIETLMAESISEGKKAAAPDIAIRWDVMTRTYAKVLALLPTQASDSKETT